MTPDLLRAASGLADLLARENDALRRLDLAAAAQMFEEKRQAMEALAALQGSGAPLAGPAPSARELAGRLAALAAENRSLLERAMTVQGRVLGTLARAAQPAASRYGARGGPAYDERRTALTLSARA